MTPFLLNCRVNWASTFDAVTAVGVRCIFSNTNSCILISHSTEISWLKMANQLYVRSCIHSVANDMFGQSISKVEHTLKMSQKIHFLLLWSGALTSAPQACRYRRAGSLIKNITLGEDWTKYTQVTAIIYTFLDKYYYNGNIVQWKLTVLANQLGGE